MKQPYARRFDEAVNDYDRGNYSQALREFQELGLELTDPWDKAEVLSHEVMTLVALNRIPEARQRVDDLSRAVASLVPSPGDGDDYEFEVSLPVMARRAELRVLAEEGNWQEALQVVEDLVSRYPKQLRIPEFGTVLREIKTLHGMLLCHARRWNEAKPVLETASPPEPSKGTHTYYLGECYYVLGIKESAKAKLLEALEFDLPSQMKSEAHFMLGLIEYNLSHVETAKRHFELCAKTVDENYPEMAKLWAWLEATSKALGQFDEAANYHRRMIDATPKRVN